MGVRVDAAQDAGPAWRAKRCGAKRVPKIDAFMPDPIHVGRLQMLVSRYAHGIPALIVREDEQDVGRLCSRKSDAGSKTRETEEEAK